MLSSKTNALLTHTLASFWRKQSCFLCLDVTVIHYRTNWQHQSPQPHRDICASLCLGPRWRLLISVLMLGVKWPRWRHQMETFSALLAICAGNSPVPGEFPAQRPVMLSFDAFFDLRPNKRLSKQSWGWWFEMPSRPLWRHCNVQASIWQYCRKSCFHNLISV